MRHIALLRAINVGGNSTIKMAELRALGEHLGFAQVKTLLQSGNLTFEADEKEAITGSKRTTLYYYLVPANVAGRWELSLPALWYNEPVRIDLTQTLDGVEGKGTVGADSFTVRDATVRGERVRFALLTRGRYMILTGQIANGRMQGEVVWAGQKEAWSAKLLTAESSQPPPRKP